MLAYSSVFAAAVSGRGTLHSAATCSALSSPLHRAVRLKIATSFRVKATSSQPSAPRALSICSRLRFCRPALTTMYSHFGPLASATPTEAKQTPTKNNFRRDFIVPRSCPSRPTWHEPEMSSIPQPLPQNPRDLPHAVRMLMHIMPRRHDFLADRPRIVRAAERHDSVAAGRSNADRREAICLSGIELSVPTRRTW